MLSLQITHLAPLSSASLRERLEALPWPEKRQRILRYRQEKDRQLALLAWSLAAAMLREAGAEDLTLTYTSQGKPFLQQHPDIHFNLSHGGEMAVCAVSDRPVGADIEPLLPYDAEQARKDASEICAKVLSNRKPPYSLAGGLFDALEDTHGDMFAVTNDEAQKACDMFKELEGVDIYHAAGVATASLIQAIENKQVNANDVIMLNITGGGEALFKQHNDVWYLKPAKVFGVNATKEEIKGFVKTNL